jgi:hypothetical protein
MTAQISELLILEGEKTSMAFCPPLPYDHQRIVETDSHKFGFSACWREYVGTWEIKDSRFYLIHLEGRYNLVGDGPLFADWFTGVLRIPRGEVLFYVHMGFETVCEEELLIEIENGVVGNACVIDNRENRM